jgi:hypothetical protein
VRLDGVALEGASGLAQELLGIAAQCVSVVPGQIRTLALNAAGEITLFDRTGLEIRLGQPADSQVKIAALPKALRTMSADRSKVAFLDGSGKVQGSKFVFYEVRRPARQP